MTDIAALKGFPIFTEHLSTLKKVSKDDHGGEIDYMTSSDLEAIDFDAVKEDYARDLGVACPTSTDALFAEYKDNLALIEFKNGFISAKKRYTILQKAYDSTLIFTDITSTTISYTRKHMKYILVYNEAKCRENRSNTKPAGGESCSRYVQESVSFDNIAKNIGKNAKETYNPFGLGLCKKYLFKDVHAYTQNEFEEYLSNLRERNNM